MTTPEAAIASYLGHLQDEAYVEAALERHGAPALVEAAVRLVRSLETENFDDAVLFIRDVSIGLMHQEITLAFRAQWQDSGLFDALEVCLRAPVFHIRTQAAYTFGKLGYPENADRLVRVLNERRDTDPLLTPQLLSEIRWLNPDDVAHRQRLQWLVDAPVGVCRWAALQAIEDTAPCSPEVPIDDLLSTLQRDRFDYLRAEATRVRTTLNSQAFTLQTPTAAERAPLLAPMTFHDLSIRFWRHHTAADYTTADLLDFFALQAPSQGASAA